MLSVRDAKGDEIPRMCWEGSRGGVEGWVAACVFTGAGSARGHGRGNDGRGADGNEIPRLRSETCGRGRDGMGPRIREDNGRGSGMGGGFLPASSRGQCLRRGMGPRMREDTGRGTGLGLASIPIREGPVADVG